MWLLWVGVALIILKVLEVSVFAELSWWWISVPLVLAMIWFEVFERRLGLDKKKAFDEMDAHKKRRIQRALEAGKARRGPRA
jgi:small Trp-rich protein